MTHTPRIIITTGGTGGHIFPALAVAEQIRRLAPDVEVLFVGSEYGSERRLAQQAGLEFVGLPVRGILGRGIHALGSVLQMLKAVCLAWNLFHKKRPDAVIGFGAYASVPSLIAAKLFGIPYAIHEQNAMPGLSNRLLAKGAARVFLALPDTKGLFAGQQCELVGNPVRQAITEIAQQATPPFAERRPRLLVLGGSQGAMALNSLMLSAVQRLRDVDIRHQTGVADEDRVRLGYQTHGHEADVMAFIDDMASAYAWADLVLCRAGASTVAELAVVGKPSVFIPFPHATHDHQTCNAQVMEKQGAALLFAETDLTHRDAIGAILELLHNQETLIAMGNAARHCARPHAAESVARSVLQLIQPTPFVQQTEQQNN